MKKLMLAIVTLGLMVSCSTTKNTFSDTGQKNSLKNTYGTYSYAAGLFRKGIDANILLKDLQDLNANTYHWLIRQNNPDWATLQEFIPLAKKNKINVWITLLPPSEIKKGYYANDEEMKKGFIQWMKDIAKLSLKYNNLTTLSIDDFAHNLEFFTPAFTETLLKTAHDLNPRLLFVPCVYYKQATQKFADDYGQYLDGILFPYRAETKGFNLQDAFFVQPEISDLRKLFKPGMPIILDVYSSPHSRLGSSTPEYVRDVVDEGVKYADGVLIFRHPNKLTDPQKYMYIKEAFKNYNL